MAGGKALAAAAMNVIMRAESVAAETAIGGAAIVPSVRAEHRGTSGSTAAARYEAH